VNDLTKFYDRSKRGTLIISTYRSGTHFLYNNLVNHLQQCNVPLSALGEVGSDDFVAESPGRYKIAILNAVVPKITLVKDQSALDEWHLVTLTRNDKLQHWISFYLWQYLNTAQQRADHSNLPHHGGTSDQYRNIVPVSIPLGVVEHWLLEQYPIHLFKSHVQIDYADLPNISGTTYQWSPNEYGLTCEELFTNHAEITQLLQQYHIPT